MQHHAAVARKIHLSRLFRFPEPPLTYQILYALAAGYKDDEIQSLTGVGEEPDAEPRQPAAELSEPFVRAEWAQIVQAKGLTDQRGYLKVSRAGRGTPLDRKKRAALWDVFVDYRARLISEGLAEPDDAYREAGEILSAEAPNLPYSAVRRRTWESRRSG